MHGDLCPDLPVVVTGLLGRRHALPDRLLNLLLDCISRSAHSAAYTA
jgi:hypothetical protein